MHTSYITHHVSCIMYLSSLLCLSPLHLHSSYRQTSSSIASANISPIPCHWQWQSNQCYCQCHSFPNDETLDCSTSHCLPDCLIVCLHMSHVIISYHTTTLYHISLPLPFVRHIIPCWLLAIWWYDMIWYDDDGYNLCYDETTIIVMLILFSSRHTICLHNTTQPLYHWHSLIYSPIHSYHSCTCTCTCISTIQPSISHTMMIWYAMLCYVSTMLSLMTLSYMIYLYMGDTSMIREWWWYDTYLIFLSSKLSITPALHCIPYIYGICHIASCVWYVWYGS